MQFKPDPGTLFYIKVKPRSQQVLEEAAGNTRIRNMVQEDGSYCEDIFICRAVDQTHLVAEHLTGFFKGETKLMLISKYTFDPVGPGMAAALGIPDLPEE